MLSCEAIVAQGCRGGDLWVAGKGGDALLELFRTPGAGGTTGIQSLVVRWESNTALFVCLARGVARG